MTNPTSNFGWQMPTSTDLVTDLPADFETFGQAVDTSLADLKGGTSGQVLSKATNTDMDFTWTTASTPAPFVAGKNKIINGDFGVWQRGSSFNLPTVTWTYTSDRFQCYYGFSAGTPTITRQTFTPGTAPVAGYESQYFLRFTAATTGTSNFNVKQVIEDVRTFAGQTITFSFWAKSSGSRNIDIFIRQNFGTGGSSSVDSTPATVTTTTAWQRFTYTVTLGSMSGKTIGTNSGVEIWPATSLTVTAGETIDIWGWQVESGSSATNFSTASQTLQGELALCQRYYYRQTFQSGSGYSSFCSGYAQTSTVGAGVVVYPVSLRTKASSVDFSNVCFFNFSGTLYALSSIAIDSNVNGLNGVLITGTISGATAGHVGFLASNASGFLGFSAEL